MSMSEHKANPFLHPLGQVAFGAYQPDDVEQAMTWAEDQAWQAVREVLALPPQARTFDNTVQALAEATEQLDSVRNVANHLSKVLGGPWHQANEAAAERATAVRNQLRFDKGLYAALVKVRDDDDRRKQLDVPRRKYLDEVVLNYERDGIALAEAGQAEVKEVFLKISAAAVAFGRHVSEAQEAAGVLVSTVGDLEGLSDEFIEGCRVAAEARGEAGYWLAYSYPNQQYVMANCRVRATRQAYYRMVVSMAAEANLPVAHELLVLRRRLANLLGYRDYADYALQLRMAKDGATAAGFIAGLADLYRAQAGAEHEELVQFARQWENDPGLELDASDIGPDAYFPAQLRAQQVGLEAEALRDYFTLGHVKQVMSFTIGALYGLEMRPVKEATWHPEVEVYEIWDGDHHLSTVWCDWYARPGKRSGAWADSFYTAPRPGGQVAAPSLVSVVCNFPAPDGTGHSRLSIRDVETLWHEFGHCLHLTCNMTELRQQSTFNTRWDFIEAPSQIMENWVWEEEVLGRMAVHHGTGQGLAPEVVASLLASRRSRVATAAMRQLLFASIDLAFHRDYQGTSAEELLSFYRTVAQGFMPVPLYPEDAVPASFSHLFAGDEYASAYYSYKWAEAIEADLFSAFKHGKLLDREVGMRYRDQVLARGAEVEPDELVRAFLGRDSTPEAMLERDGVRAYQAANKPERAVAFR